MPLSALVRSCRVRGYAASAAGVPAVRAVCPPRRGIISGLGRGRPVRVR
jgi:hypothetical protein